MKQLLFEVEFKIKTSEYQFTEQRLTTVVLALSYDDAATKVQEQYSIYAGFTLGTITPKGIPQPKLVNNIASELKRQLQ